MDKYLTKYGVSQKCDKQRIKRKYKDDYIEFGFIAIETEDPQMPLCVVYNKKLTNEAPVPSKLKRHLEISHPEVKNKPREYFENLAAQQNKTEITFSKYIKMPEKGLIASYKVAQLLAQRKKAHTDAESIIAPALEIIVETMLGKEAADKVKKVPLSNDTISCRIEDLSSDLKTQIVEHFELHENEFSSLQIDESTDISGKSQLIAFIRFVKDEKFLNEYLFCKDLKSTTTGKDIFELVKENISSFGLLWKNCVGICTYGCPSMLGNKKGFITLVQQKNQNIISVHCMINREAIVSKPLIPDMLVVLEQVIQVINFIKSRPLKSRIFYQLCDAMDSKYKTLLYHTEVSWLSKGKVLKRLVHLKEEVILFLEVKKTSFKFSLHDEIWWLKVQFLSDLFEKLNFLNLSLQGPSENIVTSTTKLKSFEEKLTLWKSEVSKEKFDLFSRCQ